VKKIVLISTYCDSIEKIEILKENIIKIKSFGLDVLVLSPLTLPSEIIELSDFIFFTKENPLLNWPVRSFTLWKSVYTNDGLVKMHHNLTDYGWANLYQVKKLSQIALSYDYDIFYHMIYDLVIDEVVKNELINNTTSVIHPRIDPHNPDILWETSLHLMVFDRPLMEKIVDEINLDDYLKLNGFAENEVLRWKNKYNIPTSDKSVKDLIYYWSNTDFFNNSKCFDYKLFINKHEPCETWKGTPTRMEILDSKLRLFFYDIKKSKKINIFCDGLDYNFLLDSNKFIELEKECLNVKQLVIDGIDYSNDYADIIRNISYIEND